MQSAGAIIDELGGTGQVASELRVADSTVSTWRKRGFIPATNWPAVVRLAADRGKREITFEALAALTEPAEARA